MLVKIFMYISDLKKLLLNWLSMMNREVFVAPRQDTACFLACVAVGAQLLEHIHGFERRTCLRQSQTMQLVQLCCLWKSSYCRAENITRQQRPEVREHEHARTAGREHGQQRQVAAAALQLLASPQKRTLLGGA